MARLWPHLFLTTLVFALFIASSAIAAAPGCPGGRLVATVEAVRQQNWFQGSPTVYERTQRFIRLPRWLGSFSITHASQGYLLSGEERLGQWTPVTVPGSITVRVRVLERSLYWPVLLPVFRDFKACRDEAGNLYIR